MLIKVEAIQRWPLWVRVTATGVAVAAAYLIQIPLEREIPGEPFLLFLLVVIGATLAFGGTTGFAGVAMTTILSIRFFEPTATFALHNAVDLIKIEVFAILATACVAVRSKRRSSSESPTADELTGAAQVATAAEAASRNERREDLSGSSMRRVPMPTVLPTPTYSPTAVSSLRQSERNHRRNDPERADPKPRQSWCPGPR